MQLGHICWFHETVLCSAPCLQLLPVYAHFALTLAAEASLLFCVACMLVLGIAWAEASEHVSGIQAQLLVCCFC